MRAILSSALRDDMMDVAEPGRVGEGQISVYRIEFVAWKSPALVSFRLLSHTLFQVPGRRFSLGSRKLPRYPLNPELKRITPRPIEPFQG